MASPSSGLNSNKRRLDNFLESFLTTSPQSSPSKPATRMSSSRSDDRLFSSAHPSPAEILESLAAKRQRLGLDRSSSPANYGVAGSQSTSTSNNILRQWGARSASGTQGPAFSSSRNSIMPVNQSGASTAASKQFVSSTPVLYNPGDRDALISRLATFQDLTDWTPKPERASEFQWAKKGWICRGRERVACSLCKRELVVGLNRKEVDGKEVSVLVASEIEEALVEKYVEMMVSEHLEDCPWRSLGCDDTLIRVPLSHAREALVALRLRYDELVDRKEFLPDEANLRLPSEIDIDTLLPKLPPDFFTSTYGDPSATTSTATDNPPNRVALALALCGWQRLSNPRMGAVRDTVSCHTCLRRLGLWMFKSKQVNPDGSVRSPAPMDHLDPIAEHRFFCPWRDPAAQRVDYSSSDATTDAAAWARLVQIVHNEANIRAAVDRKRSKSLIGRQFGGNSAPSTPAKEAGSATAPNTPGAASAGTDDAEDDEHARVAKEKVMYSRLRRIKSLFVPKDKDKERDKGKVSRAASRASLGRFSSPPPATDQPSV